MRKQVDVDREDEEVIPMNDVSRFEFGDRCWAGRTTCLK